MPKYKNPGKVEFTGKMIATESGGMYLEFPHSVPDLFGVAGRVPIKCKFDGKVPYRGSLVKMGTDCHVLIVLKEIRKSLEKQEGDKVSVVVELDSEERKVELADDVLQVLKKNKPALSFWDKLSFTNQREFHLWIESAKRSETRSSRIEQMMEKLEAGEKLR